MKVIELNIMANRLASTTSAYLQKHANNPVDWWSWTDEAFAEAKKRDLPLFISIGYFSCHWCSVMERESFEDKATAEFLNSNFICIKVDRDEMPDIDRIYQRYYNTLTGEAGGWPLSIYAFPDGIPFYIATYLPRKFSLRSRTFMSLNREIAESWQNERDPLFDISSGLSRNLDSSNKVVLSGSKSLSDNIFVAELSALQERMDWKYGGFSGEPKFPRFSTLEFLLKEGMRRDSDTLKQFVKSTIIKMSNGGIYDRLNGGIARYSVDERWDIPHFEKMLYDQAGWLRLLANLYAVDLEETFLSLIEFQLFFLREWMTSEDGLFYSSVDAETGGEEGAFYIFTYEEIRSVLDLEYNGKRVQIGPLSVLFDNRFQKNSLDFEIFSQRYGIKRRGNIRDPNITIKAGNVLKATKTVDQVLKQLDIEIKGYYESINRSTQLLREYQAKREKPAIDTKVITAWNALVITSLLTAYEKTRLPAASEMATRALDRLLQSVYVDSAIYRTPERVIQGILDDYVFLVEALILAFEVTDRYEYIERALEINELIDAKFYDNQQGAYFLNSETEIGRILLPMDDSFQSAMSTQIANLYKLGKYADQMNLVDRGTQIVQTLLDAASSYKTSMSSFFSAAAYYLHYPDEFVLFNGDESLEAHTLSLLRPERMIYRWPAQDNRPLWDVVSDRGSVNESTLYVCQGATCSMPIQSTEEIFPLFPERRLEKFALWRRV